MTGQEKATEVKVRKRATTFTDKNGNIAHNSISEWISIQYVKSSDCDHTKTVCDECLRAWMTDFDVIYA